MGGFLEHTSGSLSNDLKPDETNRLLAKDIERRQSLPFNIAGGSRLEGSVDLDYFANASAGTFTETVDLDLSTVCLGLVWFIYELDKTGSVTIDDTKLMGPDVLITGGTATASWNKTTLTITAETTNVGWPNLLQGTFYYVFYYDQPYLGQLASLRYDI